jgi:hypothetical protein
MTVVMFRLRYWAVLNVTKSLGLLAYYPCVTGRTEFMPHTLQAKNVTVILLYASITCIHIYLISSFTDFPTFL